MIAFAPITRIVDWLTTDRVWRDMRRQIPSSLGLGALDVAKAEVAAGAGESEGNNRGADLERYRGGHGGKGAWCAAFVFYCFLTAAFACGRELLFRRTHGARKLFRRIVAAGHLVKLDDLQPGDVVLWARGPNGSWKAHIGIVSGVVRENGRVATWSYIAGNEGTYPALVREYDGTKKKRRIGFARAP